MAEYEAYKDSGAEWLGNVPAHWEIVRLQTQLDEVNEKNDPVQTTQILSLTNKLGVVPYEDKGNQGNKSKEDVTDYKIAYPNCIVANSMNILIGSVGLSQYYGCVSPVYYVFHAKTGANIEYLNYIFSMPSFQRELRKYANGILEIRLRVSSGNILKRKVAIPPADEQKAIVDYLNTETQRIDAIISEAKASIEEYKAWKASIIYEAVTKGLDPNVEMKDSGVEWIDQVPANMHISRVGLHFDVVLGKMLCPLPLDHRYSLEPYFCAANVHFSGIDTDQLKKMWFSPEEKEKYLVRQGDLLVVEGGAGAGGCAIYDFEETGIYIQNSIMIVRSKGNSDNRYLKYLLELLVYRGYIEFVCNKATIPHFTKEKLSEAPFPVFSLKEQANIADYLENRCRQIDVLIFEKNTLISDLEAYKKSLIFEVVTGKRKVV